MRLFKIFFSFFVVVGLFWGISLFFPHTYRVERSIEISKPVPVAFHFMQDLRNWEKWSLWNNETDSTLTIFYGRHSDSGTARQYFNGKLIGSGRFKFEVYEPNRRLGYSLYMHGGEVNANGTFLFDDVNGHTRLHWLDSGDVGNNPFFRYMLPSKISSTEKTFDEGLQRIKAAIEKQ